MDFLPVPVTTKFFRINPQAKGTGSSVMCLRFEVYGYDAGMFPKLFIQASKAHLVDELTS